MLVNCLIFFSLFSFGCFLLYKERKLINLGFRSYFWPHTKGLVKDMRHESYLVTSMIGTSGTGIGPARQTDTLYIYEYHVSGKTYCTENYCFGTRGEMFAAEYELEHHVPVYYDPNKPEIAVIQRGIKPTAIIGLLPIFLAATYLMIIFLMN
jgi:hypothetical protein